ncbi:hypothetical protein OIU76_025655 [Salix suchowensis]|nr:hypothetical protein OIU76_025655 [Salix suchowensis]
MHKSSAIATSSFEDIQNPVQIATRGTVGSLVMLELKYFSQVESSHGSSQKSQPHVTVMASTSNQSQNHSCICSINPEKKTERRKQASTENLFCGGSV